jgi:outer membrane biogenesis lipoprotein LolB
MMTRTEWIYIAILMAGVIFLLAACATENPLPPPVLHTPVQTDADQYWAKVKGCLMVPVGQRPDFCKDYIKE